MIMPLTYYNQEVYACLIYHAVLLYTKKLCKEFTLNS